MQDDFDDGTMELPDDVSGGSELPDVDAGGEVETGQGEAEGSQEETKSRLEEINQFGCRSQVVREAILATRDRSDPIARLATRARSSPARKSPSPAALPGSRETCVAASVRQCRSARR